MAERAAEPETANFVEADRRRLVGARLKPQHRLPGVARLALDSCEQRLPDPAPARRLAGVHALHFGIVAEQGDGAAADRPVTQMGEKKAEVGLEHLFDREAVLLLRLVDGAEDGVQFRDELFRVGRRAGKSLDYDLHMTPTPALPRLRGRERAPPTPAPI